MKSINQAISACACCMIFSMVAHPVSNASGFPNEKKVDLKYPAKTIHLNNYSITDIVDERLDKNRIGYMRTAIADQYFNVDYNNSLKNEIKKFTNECVTGNGIRLTLHIYEYFLSERATPIGSQVALSIHFALYNETNERLLDYYDIGSNATAINMKGKIESLLSTMMSKSLLSMDSRIALSLKEYNGNNKMPVNCVLVRMPDNKNYYAYNSQKPVTKFHFGKHQPQNTNKPFYADCGLKTSYQVICTNGKLSVNVQLLPYFDMSNSWINPATLSDSLLEYVQTYFKITASATKEMIDEINEKDFTLQNIKPALDDLMEKYTHKIQLMEDQFLQETAYQTTSDQYENWERHIAFYPDIFAPQSNTLYEGYIIRRQ